MRDLSEISQNILLLARSQASNSLDKSSGKMQEIKVMNGVGERSR